MHRDSDPMHRDSDPMRQKTFGGLGCGLFIVGEYTQIIVFKHIKNNPKIHLKNH
jgi:hypothetical protein